VSLGDIGIVVQGPAGDGDALTGNAFAVLREVRALLDNLLESDQPGAVDLRAMPLSDADLAWLASRLGRGEVRIELTAGGPSTIVETQASGVWWVTHRNERDKVVAEFIEVAWVPNLVAAQREDAKLGSAYLDTLIQQQVSP